MSQASYGILTDRELTTSTMRALVFRGPNRLDWKRFQSHARQPAKQ